jgi:cardiolipin synthase
MPTDGNASTEPSRSPRRSAVLTVPNVLSFSRIVAIPFVAWAILHGGTEAVGLLGFGLLASTDWIDGYVARRTGSVTELGKVLDPVADRLAVIAVLIALVVRDAFPLWAAALVVVRDALLLIAGAVVLSSRGIRIDVRPIGKAATLLLMTGIPFVAWGAFDLWLGDAATVVGWIAYAAGIVLSYAAAVRYALDLRAAIRGATPSAGS